MRLRDTRVIMWNVEDSDVTDHRNFCPAYLVKVSDSEYEIMDDGDDICFATLQMDGDDGLENIWGTFMKFPDDEFIDYCKDHSLFVDGEFNRFDGDDSMVSPRRRQMRKTAAKNMDRSSKKVIKRLKHKAGNVHVGDVVHIPLVQQDRCKVDAHNLTGVVVNINESFGVCQVAVKSGVLRPWYVYHKLRVVPGISNNRVLNDLEDAFKNWKNMDFIAPRTASANESLVGGQGIFQCDCKGKCTNNRCSCFKNGRTCNSACHRNSRCCENHDETIYGKVAAAAGKTTTAGK
jgi:hypothetical protein